jgi:ElaB/YqjD/DUF883 family membrane-anchored ribosome-binding protein
MNFKKLTVIMAFLFSGMAFASINMEKEYKELKQTTEKKMEVMDRKLEKLGKKVDSLQGTAKVELKKTYEEMIDMKDELKNRLASAGETSSEMWDDTKDKVEDYADDLESKIDKAIN